MENLNEGRAIYQPRMCYGAKNPPKIVDNCGDCEYQVECISEENIRLAKIFSKVMIQLEKRYGNNVPTNIKNSQHKEKGGEKKNLNYSYRWKGIQCLNCKYFGHIQGECSKQRRISNVTNDE